MKRCLFPLALSLTLLPLTVQALPNNPNQAAKPEPGWGPWRPQSELEKAGIAAGFSNMELGGFLDFQNACSEATGLPMDAFPNWFRTNQLINQIGTGEIEYGCWHNGKFVNTMTSTAVNANLENVECLRVTANPVTVHADADPKSRRRRTLRKGARVNPGTFPALVSQVNNQYWVRIDKPVQGWILQGTVGQTGNLSLCGK